MHQDDAPDDVMAEHGFPATLLPGNVARSSFHTESGSFEVVLAGEVTRPVESYRVRYQARITGVLEPGRIHGLRGVKVKRGLWFPVSQIVVEGDRLVFHVGPVHKRLSAAAFGDR